VLLTQWNQAAEQVIGVASLVQDVTQKLESQKELKDHEASFRALF
jgi:hypothetical protein